MRPARKKDGGKKADGSQPKKQTEEAEDQPPQPKGTRESTSAEETAAQKPEQTERPAPKQVLPSIKISAEKDSKARGKDVEAREDDSDDDVEAREDDSDDDVEAREDDSDDDAEARVKLFKSSLSLSPRKGKGDDVKHDEVKKKMKLFSSAQEKLLSRAVASMNVPMRLKTWHELRNISLKANYFQLTFDKTEINWYRVRIAHLPGKNEGLKYVTSETEKRLIVINALKPKQPKAQIIKSIYGGRRDLYTEQSLTSELKKELSKTVQRRGKKFEVVATAVIKDRETNKFELQTTKENLYYEGEIPVHILTFVKTCLRNNGLENKLTFVDDYIYDEKGEVDKTFEGAEEQLRRDEGAVNARFCCSHEIILTSQGISVHLDISAAVFHKSRSILQFASDLLNRKIADHPTLTETEWKTLSAAVVKGGLRVISEQFQSVLSVKGLTKSSAKDAKLETEDEPTVEKYFLENFKIKLKYPNLPCLQIRVPEIIPKDETKPKKTRKDQTKPEKIPEPEKLIKFMPLEVCTLPPGVRVRGELDKETAKSSSLSPENRFNLILKYAEMTSSVVAGFGLKLEPFEFPGVVHKSPFIKYSSESGVVPITPNERGWWGIRGDKKFLKGVKVKKWMLVSFVESEYCTQPELIKFAAELRQTAKRLGLRMNEPEEVAILGEDEPTSEALLYAKQKEVDLLVVVLSSSKDSRYDDLKYTADIDIDLVTQCVDSSGIMKDGVSVKRKPYLILSLCQKINAKMGGINHALYNEDSLFSNSSSIIFGARTAAPPISCKGSVTFSSLASVVGSLDAHPFRYAACCRLQIKPKGKVDGERKMKWRSQLILELKDMVKKILTKFCSKTKSKPNKIIFYRHGITETHFQKILNFEVPMIKEACKEIDSSYCPNVTYIMVQKKSGLWIRSFDKDDDMRIPSGTVVDTGITNPTPLYNYYLFSQETSKKSATGSLPHYTLLYDENCFTSAEIQRISYHLCHTYARCTHSISVPVPIKYSSLVVKRVKGYVDLQLLKYRQKGQDYDPNYVTGRVIEFINNIELLNNMFYV